MPDTVSSGLAAQAQRLLRQIECLEGQHTDVEEERDRNVVVALKECRQVLQRVVPPPPPAPADEDE